MQKRGILIVVAAILATSFGGHAATPAIKIVAVSTNGMAVVLDSSKNTLVVRATATALPVRAKLDCLRVDSFSSSLGPISGKYTEVMASAHAGTKRFYFTSGSFRPLGEKVLGVMTAFGLSTTPGPSECQAVGWFHSAYGVIIFG
jgi:hypothetical protein